MERSEYLFTSESVSEGHPDKICDRISDAVVDLYLAADPQARVAVETLVTTNRIVLAGEVRGPEEIGPDELEQAARECVRDIGYEQEGFHWRKADVQIYVHNQSVDIAQGVDAAGNKDEGAGDQGILFGYACHPTTLSFTKWCGDYPGFAQIEIERQHPGATAMFVNTCGGDQNPLPRRKIELCRKYTSRICSGLIPRSAASRSMTPSIRSPLTLPGQTAFTRIL